MSQSIQQILLPNNATADHVIAAFLLKAYGEKQYPGIAQATVTFTRPDTAAALDLATLLPPGHQFEGATDAVAQQLTLSRLPELQLLLKWASQFVARKQPGSPFDLGGLVPVVVQASDPQQLELIFGVLRLQLEQQKKLYYGLPEEWVTLTKEAGPSDLYDLKIGDRTVVVAVAQSASQGIAEFLFQNKKTNADVVIQEFADGRVDIFTNPVSAIDLSEVAKVTRLEEARVHQRDYTMTLRIFFAHEGFAEDSPEWWYDKSGQALLNHSAPDSAPVSGLSTQDILSAVYVGLSSDVWEKDCPPVGCRGNVCYFYDYGLARCRAREIAVVPDTFEQKFKEKASSQGGNRHRDRSQNRRQNTSQNTPKNGAE